MNARQDERQARYPFIRTTLTAYTEVARMYGQQGVAPEDLWEKVEQLLLSLYVGRDLETALTDLPCLAAAALLEHDRHPGATLVDLAGWQDYHDENGPWPEMFSMPAEPVDPEDLLTWARLASALEGKHVNDVIPLGTAPNRLARLAAGAITRVAVARG